jgi:hypothetical protein
VNRYHFYGGICLYFSVFHYLVVNTCINVQVLWAFCGRSLPFFKLWHGYALLVPVSVIIFLVCFRVLSFISYIPSVSFFFTIISCWCQIAHVPKMYSWFSWEFAFSLYPHCSVVEQNRNCACLQNMDACAQHECELTSTQKWDVSPHVCQKIYMSSWK